MTIVPATELELEQLAELFTAGYEGYYVPVHVDAAALRFIVDSWDIDLERSRVALRGDEPVGLALLAVRGDDAWVGGVGVVADARRTGVGRALMEAILAEAPGPVTLEVIEQNTPALALYEALGFEHTRILEVWSLATEVTSVEARTVDPGPLGQDDLPWQRADASLPPEYERIEVDGAAALIRCNGPRVSILQLEARDAPAAAQILAAARARGETLHYVNVPEGDPACQALRELGGTLDLRQFELRRSGPG